MVRVIDIRGFKTLDVDVMPAVVPNDFINELNARIEKDFGYKSKDVMHIPIGF